MIRRVLIHGVARNRVTTTVSACTWERATGTGGRSQLVSVTSSELSKHTFPRHGGLPRKARNGRRPTMSQIPFL